MGVGVFRPTHTNDLPKRVDCVRSVSDARNRRSTDCQYLYTRRKDSLHRVDIVVDNQRLVAFVCQHLRLYLLQQAAHVRHRGVVLYL